MHSPAPPADTVQRPGFREFVVLMAGLMALNALAIDIMLPALPDISRAFGLANDNDRQLVVVAYVSCFGIAQLFKAVLQPLFPELSRVSEIFDELPRCARVKGGRQICGLIQKLIQAQIAG